MKTEKKLREAFKRGEVIEHVVVYFPEILIKQKRATVRFDDRSERIYRFGKRKGTLRALMFFGNERCHVLIFLPFSASMKFLSLMVCVQ